MLKIGYFADGPWSHEAFNRLIDDKSVSIAFVCVRYDTKDATLREYCIKHDIPCLKHENVNSAEFIGCIQPFECDLLVSMSFNQIFRAILVDAFPLGAINCHAGKLPFYKGRNILNWALINDEREFGITVHFVDEGIDTGDIIIQEIYPIDDDDTYATLLERAYIGCADVLYEAIKQFVSGTVTRCPQSEIHPVGFYCSQRKVGDEVLDWSLTSRELFNFIRSICLPGPLARAFVNGQEVKINKAKLIDDAPQYHCITGAILHISNEGVLVKTKDSMILLVEYEYNKKFKVGDRFDV